MWMLQDVLPYGRNILPDFSSVASASLAVWSILIKVGRLGLGGNKTASWFRGRFLRHSDLDNGEATTLTEVWAKGF